MTTTAFDDQFTSEPEPVHHPYSTADILRRNRQSGLAEL